MSGIGLFLKLNKFTSCLLDCVHQSTQLELVNFIFFSTFSNRLHKLHSFSNSFARCGMMYSSHNMEVHSSAQHNSQSLVMGVTPNIMTYNIS